MHVPGDGWYAPHGVCLTRGLVPPTGRGLEQRGWLTRQVDSADRRINVLVLTLAGREMRERLMHQLLEPPEAIRRLSGVAQHRLREVLLALVRELGEPSLELFA